MKRNHLLALVAAVPVAALIWWIASNTYFDDVKVPMPPKGEALTNPFYSVQKFADALGARTQWDRVLTVPPADSVIVLHAWHWSLSASRRQTLERWVESGGRLVIDDSLSGGEDEFERWSGIVRHHREFDDDELDKFLDDVGDEDCREFDVEPAGPTREMCHVPVLSFLGTTRPPEWTLRDKTGMQAARVGVGRGSVTVVNNTFFLGRDLFEGDHGWLFVAATQFKKNDHVVFLSERDHPSLLALLWQHGAPAVSLALVLIGLLLWRGSVRFGPLIAAPAAARRSLAEQIRGTGQFVLRHGSGDALHAASVRALNEAAQRRIPNYTRLSPDERVAALAHVTGFDRSTLTAAVHQAGVRRSHNLRTTIALIESVRRQLLIDTHGT